MQIFVFYGILYIFFVMELRGVLVSVNFDCFSPTRFSHFHGNAMRKTIKAHKNWHTILQNEHTPFLFGARANLKKIVRTTKEQV